MQERPTLAPPLDASYRSVDLKTVLPEIVNLVMDVTWADACFIYLLDETRNLLILRASSETGNATKARVLMKLGDRQSCRGNPVDGSPLKLLPEVHEDDTCASLSVPLVASSDRLIGILNVRYELTIRQNRSRWSLLTAVAQKVADAIENADLCNATSRYALGITQAGERLQNFAMDDSLTGLPNYGFFHESLDRELLRAVHYGQPLALALFDIDRFSEINETYGYTGGDQALQAIAGRLLENCRYSDVAFRYGGDEFGMLLPGTDEEKARQRVEDFRAELEVLGVRVSPRTLIRVSISSGIATFDPDQPIDKAAFIKLAETALCKCKDAWEETRNNI